MAACAAASPDQRRVLVPKTATELKGEILGIFTALVNYCKTSLHFDTLGINFPC